MKKTKAPAEQAPIEIEASATSENVILQTLVTLDVSKADAALALLKKEFSGIIIDCSTPVGFKDAMSTRSKLIKLRTKGDAKRLEMNREDMKPINDRNAVWKKIEPVLLQLEGPIDRSIKAQQEIDKENARLAAVAEEARKTGILQRIDKIKALLPSSVSLTAAALETRITTVEAAPITVEAFQEFAEEAAEVKAEIVAGMKEMLITKKDQEAEAERVKLRERISAIRDWPRLVFGKPSAEIEVELSGYLDIEFPSFGELQEEADAARDESILQCMNIMETTKENEIQAAELTRLKAAQPKPEPIKETPAVEPAKTFAPLTTESATVEPAKKPEPAKAESEADPMAVLWAHVAAYNESEFISTARESLIETIFDADRVWRGHESPRRWWTDCFTVVNVDGMLIGFDDAITTGDDTPRDKGWEFDPESICPVIAREITVTVYERAE